MGILDVLRTSVHDYVSNRMLLVPAAISTLGNLLPRSLFSPTALAQAGGDFGFDMWPLFIFSLSGLITFLALLGRVVMTGKVIAEGKTKLIHWVTEGRKFFFSVLGISIAYNLLGLALTPLTRFFYGWMTPTNLYSVQSLLVANLNWLLMGLIPYSFLLFWLASDSLHEKGTVRSLVDTLRTLRYCLAAFAGFVLLYFVVMWLASWPIDYALHENLLLGSIILADIVTRIVGTVLSPLWFLIAFRLYHIHQTQQQVKESSLVCAQLP